MVVKATYIVVHGQTELKVLGGEFAKGNECNLIMLVNDKLCEVADKIAVAGI